MVYMTPWYTCTICACVRDIFPSCITFLICLLTAFSHVISYCTTSIEQHFTEIDLKGSISSVVRLLFVV
jgi:hypothetical protein